MAILEGGIFSNPRGKTGGLVFGAARTRTGKKVTSRLLVPPSNPNTAAQQTQRGKFAEALAIVRLVGPTFYQADWNRAIGQLPGFQSMTSVFLNSLNDSFVVGTIPSINLGSLHVAADFDVVGTPPAGRLAVSWGTEDGLNGTGADDVVIIGVSTNPAASPLERFVIVDTNWTRGDGAAEIDGFGAGLSGTCLMWMRGAGTAEGLLSATSFGQALAGA